jgi:hypothetical protein
MAQYTVTLAGQEPVVRDASEMRVSTDWVTLSSGNDTIAAFPRERVISVIRDP